MAKFFFSYSRADRSFARELEHSLRALGHDTWIDEDQILWGDSFIDRTQDALRAASAVIVLLSEHSRDSQWIAFELGAATAQGKKVFPVVLSDDPTVVPFQLRSILYLRANPSEPVEVARRIHEALQRGA